MSSRETSSTVGLSLEVLSFSEVTRFVRTFVRWIVALAICCSSSNISFDCLHMHDSCRMTFVKMQLVMSVESTAAAFLFCVLTPPILVMAVGSTLHFTIGIMGVSDGAKN